MLRAGMCVAAGVLATLAAWAAIDQFTPLEAAPPADTKTVADAKDAKPVDLSALREAIATASKRGENVDEISKALDAFEKSQPKSAAGRVPPELQALRDAVDAAARKGENVEAIAKELVAVEMAVAGKSLAKPRPEPRPQPQPQPGFPGFPQPVPDFPQLVPLPAFPVMPNAGIGGGIDVELFNKAMDLQRRATELMLKDPADANAIKEAQKLRTEASELLLKAARNGIGGAGGVAGVGGMPLFPEFGRVPDRVRLGIRMERVPAVATEQLGLEPNTGIAVTMIVAGSAAEKAGLKVHDIILEFAGKPVTDNTEDFARRVGEVKVGEKVDLVVLRKGKKVEVKGVELPDAAKQQLFPQPFPALPAPGVRPEQPRKPLPALPVNPKPLPVNPQAVPVPVPGVFQLNPQPLPINPIVDAPGAPNG